MNVALCVSRPGGWFSIEPIIEVGQFLVLRDLNGLDFLSYSEYLNHAKHSMDGNRSYTQSCIIAIKIQQLQLNYNYSCLFIWITITIAINS